MVTVLLASVSYAGLFSGKREPEAPVTCSPPLSVPSSTELHANQALRLGLLGSGNGAIECALAPATA
jgi:hypothetical protein